MLDVLCAGEVLWDLVTPGGTSLSRSRELSLRPGGGAVNTALELRKRGLSVGIAAGVGDDPMGRALVARLERLGLDVRGLLTTGARTGLFIQGARGRSGVGREVQAYRDFEAAPPEVPRGLRARWLVLSGLLPLAAQAEVFVQAASRARRGGATVVLDVNTRPRAWRGREEGLREVEQVLGAADVVKVSMEDLRVLGLGTGEPGIGGLQRFLRRGATLLVTDGAAVSRAIGMFGEARAMPRSVVRGGMSRRGAPDAMGAGDAFLAGLLAYLAVMGVAALDEGAWQRALARGNAAAGAWMRRSR